MGSYSVWRKAADRGDFKRLTFVCGSESVLIEEVIDKTKSALGVADYHSFNMESDSPDKFFDALFQYPLSEAPRLLMVRETDRVKDWKLFSEWMEESYLAMPNTHVLMTSSAASVHIKEAGQWVMGANGKRAMREPAGMFGTRGRIVECKPMVGEALVHWAAQQAPGLGLNLAHYLTQRVGEDHARIKFTARKLDLFRDHYIDKATIDDLAQESIGDKFVDLLVRGKKYQATLAIPNIRIQDYPRVFRQLDRMLDVLSTLNSELRRYITKREQQQIPGVTPWHVENYGRISFAYDVHKVRRCRNALAYLEDVYQTDGITYLDEEDGILEALVTLWL